MYTVNVMPEETKGIVFEAKIGEAVKIKIIGVTVEEAFLLRPDGQEESVTVAGGILSVPSAITSVPGYVMVRVGTAQFGFRMVEEKQDDRIEAKDVIAIASDGGESTVQAELSKKAEQTQLETKAERTQMINPNILDNWDFRNPVNQRGVARFAINNYSLDRWIGISGTCTVDGDGITLSGGIRQRIDAVGSVWALNGKTLTASVMLKDGTVISGQLTPSSDAEVSITVSGVTFILMNEAYSTKKAFDIITTSALGIAAVKIEVGDVCTLQNDPPMVYADMLMRCYRYYYTKDVVSDMWFVHSTGTSILARVRLPRPMRVNPTCTVSGDLKFYTMTDWTAASTFTSKTASPNNNGTVQLSFNGTFTSPVVWGMATSTNGLILTASADL